MRRFVPAVLAVLLVLPISAMGADKADQNVLSNTMSVKVTGEAKSMPEVADLSFTVAAEGNTIGEAQEQFGHAEDALVSAIQGSHLSKKDLKFEAFIMADLSVIQPAYGTQEIRKGYRVQKTYSISIPITSEKDAEKTFLLENTLVKNGAHVAHGDSLIPGVNMVFRVKDQDKLYRDALSNAITKAYEVANATSEQIGKHKAEKVKIEIVDAIPMGYPYGFSQAWQTVTAKATINATFALD